MLGLLLCAIVAPAAGASEVARRYAEAQASPETVLAAPGRLRELPAPWPTLIEARALHYANRFDDAQSLLLPQLLTLDREQQAQAWVAAHRLLGQNHYRLGNMDQALAAALEAETLALERGIDNELGHLDNLIGAIHLRTGRTDLALERMEAALARFQAQQQAGEVAKLENNLAVLYMETGDLERAEDHLLASIELARRLERRSTLISNLVNLVELRAGQGRFDEAQQRLEECFDVADQGAGGGRVFCHEAATELYGRKDALASAIDNTRRAIELAEAQGLHQVALDNQAALAELLARDGDYEAAYAAADEARRRMLSLRDAAVERRLADLQALLEAERARLRVIQLEARSVLQQRRQRGLLIGLAIALPLLGLSAWTLRMLRRERDRSAALARTDPLTGLDNRRALTERLQQAQLAFEREGLRYALVMLDLDHFKSINDQHGHAVGDAVLEGVADCIRSALRPEDAAGRWGGEEFLLLVAGSAKDANDRVERIREDLGALALGPRITGSFGIAEARPEQSLDDVLQRADRAQYASKRGGRDRVTVSD